jgi:hypothetical protein
MDEAGLHEMGMETAVITHICVQKITMQFRFFFMTLKLESVVL